MTTRAPIHLGSGEPVVLLHPFMLSQAVWADVAVQLADTGRYEVFAPTLAGHNGGPRGDSWLLSASILADHVERQMDELGWRTAHLVGNSLGGWLAYELAGRGRARTVTGIAPAGGWTRWTPCKFEVIAKFLAGLPLWLAVLAVGDRILRLPWSRQIAALPLAGSADRLTEAHLHSAVDDLSHCPAYYRLLLKTLLEPGLTDLTALTVPAHLVNCTKDRVVPAPRFTRLFTTGVAALQVSTLEGMGHIPMLEAPGAVTETITGFLDRHVPPMQAETPAG
ncbi:alpha/beta hydrolase [Mycolicibacillus parakoreensis]|uniref:Alpha/beta hydrolase n=1 Tax=Mycolicibacillus parakoreensis TaxID=1069221 RepID=A0ABY3U0C5_9MYCO|nr:alpha/beta hydrolase [Mycolicibacillus parakoreensis]MCV7315492.1 alpha/beta hydrolase [Mycolicibacillus parakoreensis]ULN52050.1 alpha/beta hydrolase [Mycolicibacillus parakoreensis]